MLFERQIALIHKSKKRKPEKSSGGLDWHCVFAMAEARSMEILV